MDVKTERLSVVLKLIGSVAGGHNVQVVCSAREFDYRHDVRFDRLSCEELTLELPAVKEVDQVLSSAGYAPDKVPQSLKEVLRSPYALKSLLSLKLTEECDLPTTWCALMEKVWSEKFLSRSEDARSCEATLRALAAKMAQREELWVPRALGFASDETVNWLVSQGALRLDERGMRIGFGHQSLYEFARARCFLEDESLADYVAAGQNSLFVRPTIWTALGYLRNADTGRYLENVGAILHGDTRLHVQLLVVEFLGAQEVPLDQEARILLALLQDPAWEVVVWRAVGRSVGWFKWLERGYLNSAMVGANPAVVIDLMTTGVRASPASAFGLLKAHWSGDEHAQLRVAVLRSVLDWDEEALRLVDESLSSLGHMELESVVWTLRDKYPEFAIRLVANSLKRELDRVVSAQTVAGAEASEVGQEPLGTVKGLSGRVSDLLCDVSGKHHYLLNLARAAPRAFLEQLVPWFATVLGHIVDRPSNRPVYLNDYSIGSRPLDGVPREFPDALKIAFERYAKNEPDGCRLLIERWQKTEFASLHIQLTFALAHLAPVTPEFVVAYLAGDERRLCLGDYQDAGRYTNDLIRAAAPYLNRDQVRVLEDCIFAVNVAGSREDRSVKARRAALGRNRAHCLNLLRALPSHCLSERALAHIDAESHVFADIGENDPDHRIVEIDSPMKSGQMARASNRDVANLFEELVDGTGWDHPRRGLMGGSVQAAREFGSFARAEPERAIAISAGFLPGLQENPAGEMITALGKSEIPTSTLEAVILDLDSRGFSSEDFRWSVSWALRERASGGLSTTLLSRLVAWLPEVVSGAPRESDASDDPPFLWGWSGGHMVPRGGYPVLGVVTVALLSQSPPAVDDWLDVVEAHLPRGDSVAVWQEFLRHLGALRAVDSARAERFLNALFAAYPCVLLSRAGVQLLARSYRWLPSNAVEKYAKRFRDSGWSHGSRAYGELVAFFGVVEPTMRWASAELEALVERESAEAERLGIAGACANLWSASQCRERCTSVVERLAASGRQEELAEILSQLREDNLVVDSQSQRVLRALTPWAQCFLGRSGDSALEWAAALVHSYPDDVCALARAILRHLRESGRDTAASYGTINVLTKLSVTFQRLAGFAEDGLDIFEALLAMGHDPAKGILEETEGWRRGR